MNNKKTYIVVGILILILVIAATVAVVSMNNRYDTMDNISQAKEKAKELYVAGDVEGAKNLMQAYCKHVTTDIEAKALLGDWLLETGKEEEAVACYYDAAMYNQGSDDIIKPLSVKNTKDILLQPVTRVVMEITPDIRITKDMTLTISSHNLVPKRSVVGKISVDELALTEDENYITTEWFDIDPDGDYLTMSGGFNCAVWQFKDENGEICAGAESNNTYRKKDTYSVNVYQMARANIPEDAVACRVTYLNTNLNDTTASLDEELTIVYGRLPGESRSADFSYYEIPDLKNGEKIIYDSLSGWTMIKDNGESETLDWKIPVIERGSFFSVGGTLPGKVTFKDCEYATFEKSGIYTIRFDTTNPSATGERLDDAKNLVFNSAVGVGNIALGENHFDNIYPWSEMKLCSIKDGKITYAGEEGFFATGESGDVFVEIPKFYYKRVVDEKYDTISISGEKHEGFLTDEAFVTRNGEVDKIYIGAYLSSTDDEKNIMSVAGTIPEVGLTPMEMSKQTRKKGGGYYELDYAALSALQKLFVVETGIRNSQYLYMGICAHSMPQKEPDSSKHLLALESGTKTNSILVESVYEFSKGDSVVLFNSKNYENAIEPAIEDVREVTAAFKNGDNTTSIYFSGEPVSVTKAVTAIAHIAQRNGTTRAVSGHTGAVSTARGTVSFKYRNIENLWGNSYVYIDGVRIKDGNVTLNDRMGNRVHLAYSLPKGKTNNVVERVIKKIGYDENYPGVMLPFEMGGDATISTYYGDTFLNYSSEEKEYVLHYGGGWDSGACAGLFSYAALATEDESYLNTTGRMMYIEK